ncbi:DUF971 domain-containing protein [Aquincola sp. S2]|uniref:DUF971 domain-containing protein n=1 Tax=Pseudaquabacterium terrae TaxID=2732868 RepID=A0ABX2EKF8_9BURK|nr:DUF971 domain-containing protein [Aquabacterium terrae]NRF69083.1 DUF971 domain-containing protein [Aquabacterium terrae]
MARASNPSPQPTALTLHQASRVLEIGFDDGSVYRIPFELLRIHSPSAEVQGHGPGQEILQTGKRDVNIVAIEPIGNYAIKPVFSDGHETGLYSWGLLYQLGSQQDAHWQRYFERLAAAGVDRDAPMPGADGAGGAGGACGHHGH